MSEMKSLRCFVGMERQSQSNSTTLALLNYPSGLNERANERGKNSEPQ
jgi:hypothetical protein